MTTRRAHAEGIRDQTTEKPRAQAHTCLLPVDREFTPRPWESGYIKRFPWGGLVALVLDICCVAASGLTLLLSNRKPTASWKVSPTVLLAIFSTSGNFFLRYARSEGATIAWWTTALKGTTLRELHRQWAFGTNLWSSIFSGRHLNILALASIFTTLCLVDGPVLQRASTVVSGQSSRPVQLQAFIAAKHGNFSTVNGFDGGNLSPELLQVLTEHATGNPIILNGTGCKGTCTGTIQTLGLNGSCPIVTNVTNDWAKDFLMNENWTMTATLLDVTFPTFYFWEMEHEPIRLLDFNVSYFTLSSETPSYVFEDSTFPTCPGHTITRSCSFNIGIVSYPISITNNTIQLASNNTLFPLVSMDSYLRAPPGENESNGYYDFNRAYGFNDAARWLFTSYIKMHPLVISTTWTGDNEIFWWNELTGSVSLQDIAATNTSTCNRNLDDPTDGILRSLNEILLRVGVAAAGNNESSLQDVSAIQVTNELVFASDFRYFFIAAAITCTGVLLVLATFQHYWMLGRNVTLDPLETAKAFDQDVLRREGTSNAELETLLHHIGDRRVKYGVFEGDQDGADGEVGKLCLADAERVRRPVSGDVMS